MFRWGNFSGFAISHVLSHEKSSPCVRNELSNFIALGMPKEISLIFSPHHITCMFAVQSILTISEGFESSNQNNLFLVVVENLTILHLPGDTGVIKKLRWHTLLSCCLYKPELHLMLVLFLSNQIASLNNKITRHNLYFYVSVQCRFSGIQI